MEFAIFTGCRIFFAQIVAAIADGMFFVAFVVGRGHVSLSTNLDTWHSKPFTDILHIGHLFVVGRGHVSRLTNVDTWHSKLLRTKGIY
jgi:hypothetical protein